MKPLLLAIAIAAGLLSSRGGTILFDFENANVHTPLPLTLTAGGISAEFSGTGTGFSIQRADTMGFTPPGFSGNCIYPSSVYAADLVINFSAAITDFSILYSPQELGCDDSATLKVTAYMNGVLIGSTLTNANQPGTWPSEYLRFSSTQPFNNVVVHYQSRPPTCQDYGVIFMADNMVISPAPQPITLLNAQMRPEGFQFAFSNPPGIAFDVLSSDNPTLPVTSWTLMGAAVEVSPGQYQFTDTQANMSVQKFYVVRGQ